MKIHSDNRLSPTGLIVSICAVSVLVQAYVLVREFNFGNLAGLLPWDDCQIVDKALQSLVRVTQADSVFGLIKTARAVAPHSAVADAQAFLAMFLTDGRPWSAYLLNVWVLLVTLGTVLWLSRRGPVAMLTTMAAVILFQPLTYNAITYIKADAKSGLLMAASLFAFYIGNVQRDRTASYFGAGLLGLTITCKLTAFYFPAVALGTVVVFALAGILADPERSGVSVIQRVVNGLVARRRSLVVQLLLAVVPFIVFFAWAAVGYDSILTYIVFALSPLWTDDKTVLERAVFYGPTENPVWGMLHWMLLAMVCAAAFMAIRTRSWAAALNILAALIVAFVLLVPMAVAKTSIHGFEGTMLGALMAATLMAIHFIGQDSDRRALGPLALVGVMVFFVRFPLDTRAQDLRDASATINRLVDDIVASESRPSPVVRLTFEDAVAGYPNLSILHFQKVRSTLDTFRIDSLEPASAVQQELAKADFVVTLVPSTGKASAGYSVTSNFPSSSKMREFDAAVAAHPGMSIAKTYPWRDGELRLYRNRDAKS